jgi:hypothetical protein
MSSFIVFRVRATLLVSSYQHLSVISVLGVASALIPLLGKAKSDGVKTVLAYGYPYCLLSVSFNTTSDSNVAFVFDSSGLSTMFYSV